LNKIRICNNDCIFCFVKQLPKNLRPTLYIKDDDYLQSFINGNFITLTNIKEKDLNKIIKYNLYPLYISLHSFDIKIRNKIFQNKNSISGVKNLKILDNNGIKTNIQIVLCPGINDGKDLENTLTKLTKYFNNIISIGIVPVGITKYNNYSELKPYTKISASEIIINFLNQIFKFFQDNKKKFFINLIDNNNNPYKKGILVITSEYGKHVIINTLKIIGEKWKDFNLLVNPYLKVISIKNDFFGGNIKVTGLLSGIDIISNLKKIKITKYSKIIIPDCIFNKDNLTIDNYRKHEIKRISNRIKIIPEDGLSFVKEIC
jgi:NifB/MoaA-like Fe-S oxidoreductase